MDSEQLKPRSQKRLDILKGLKVEKKYGNFHFWMRKVYLFVWLFNGQDPINIQAGIDNDPRHEDDYKGQTDVELRKELFNEGLLGRYDPFCITQVEATEAWINTKAMINPTLPRISDIDSFIISPDPANRETILEACKDLYDMFSELMNKEVLEFIEDRRCSGAMPRLG